jgi:outer membrane receptor for ferrienterochelin and colicin
MDKPADEHIFSQYFDYQFRPLENVYSTIGLRSDEHSLAGRKKSGRATLAYKLDSKRKIRSSFGTGIRFPSLYDYHYADGNTAASGGGSVSGDGYSGMTLEELKAERGISYDLGYDTSIKNLNLNLTYFNIKQKNPLVSDSRNNWKMRNENGVNTSEGIELMANWRPKNKKMGIDINYTFTDSYDSNTCYVGDCTIHGSKLATAKVRVPIHAISTKFTYNTGSNLQNSLLLKFVDETRDFGNTNNSFKDVILDDYLTLNFSSTYKLFDSYKLYFDAVNLFDENYEQAYQYSTLGRTLNFGIKRVY